MDPNAPLPPDENRGPAINAVAWIGAAISTLFVALRLYSRVWISRTVGWDDYMIVLSAALNIVTCAFTSVAIDSGLGRHFILLTPEERVRALYYSALQRPPGILAYCLPKLSIVLLLGTLMGKAKTRKWLWFLHGLIVVLFITSCLSFILFFCRCTPVESLWTIPPPPGTRCFPAGVLNVVTYVSGAWSAFVDIVLAAFPIYLLWDLQMKRQQKLTTMTVMALGFLASIAAIAKTTQLELNNPLDPTFGVFYLFIATYVETNLVIVAACAPALPRIFKFHRGEKSTTDNSYGQSGSYPLSNNIRDYREFDSHGSTSRIVPKHGSVVQEV